jgi:hypothetical protein
MRSRIRSIHEKGSAKESLRQVYLSWWHLIEIRKDLIGIDSDGCVEKLWCRQQIKQE